MVFIDEWSMIIIMMGCGRGIAESRDRKNAQGSRPLQVASSSPLCVHFRKDFALKWRVSFDLL